MEILGDAFGIVILNDIDDYLAIVYKTYLDPFEHVLMNDENCLKMKISTVSNKTCFFMIVIVSVNCFFISDIMVLGSVEMFAFNGI